MADYDNPAFDPDEADPADEDDALFDPTEDVYKDLPAPRPENTVPFLQHELLQDAVNDYYKTLANEGLTPSLGIDMNKFELVDGKLRLKAYPDISIINKRTGRPIKFSTLYTKPKGNKAIREELGFPDWTRSPSQPLPAQAANALRMAEQELRGAAAAAENIDLLDLGQTAQKASDASHLVISDTQVDELIGTINDPPLDLRELRGLDRALQTIRGELTNNLAKLTELDSHIAMEKRKLDEADNEFSRRRIASRLRDLQDERSSRLEAAGANREDLRTQINRMRETIARILNEDTTLAERIRTLFREQGVTIASILTAIGMAISTLVLALTGGSGASPPPPWQLNLARCFCRALVYLLARFLKTIEFLNFGRSLMN